MCAEVFNDLPDARERTGRLVSAAAIETPAEMRSALLDVLGTYRPGTTVSTAQALRELKRRMPVLTMADEELVNIIADGAIELGFSVMFDSRGG